MAQKTAQYTAKCLSKNFIRCLSHKSLRYFIYFWLQNACQRISFDACFQGRIKLWSAPGRIFESFPSISRISLGFFCSFSIKLSEVCAILWSSSAHSIQSVNQLSKLAHTQTGKCIVTSTHSSWCIASTIETWTFRPLSKWTTNSDKKLNVNNKYIAPELFLLLMTSLFIFRYQFLLSILSFFYLLCLLLRLYTPEVR